MLACTQPTLNLQIEIPHRLFLSPSIICACSIKKNLYNLTKCMKWYLLLQNTVHIQLKITIKLYHAILSTNFLQINVTLDLLMQMLTFQN